MRFGKAAISCDNRVTHVLLLRLFTQLNFGLRPLSLVWFAVHALLTLKQVLHKRVLEFVRLALHAKSPMLRMLR